MSDSPAAIGMQQLIESIQSETRPDARLPSGVVHLEALKIDQVNHHAILVARPLRKVPTIARQNSKTITVF